MISQIISQILRNHEKICIDKGDLEQAEIAANKIEDLKQNEMMIKGIFVAERNKEEVKFLKAVAGKNKIY